MQERKSNQCKESNSNHCKRARRKDAEPITPRMSENFLGYRLILLVIKSGALFFRYFLRLDDSVSDAFHDN